MLFLFALIAVASATDYLFSQSEGMPRIKEMNKCMNTKDDRPNPILKYKKIDAFNYQLCSYEYRYCEGTEECGENIPLQPGESWITTLPDYVLKMVPTKSEDCEYSYYEAEYFLHLEGCNELNNNTWMKTEIVGDKAVARYYTEDECKTEFSGNDYKPVEITCNACQNVGGADARIVCNTKLNGNEEYVTIQHGPIMQVIEMDKCMNLKKDGVQSYFMYKIVDANNYQLCMYEQSGCKGTENCTEVTPLQEGGKFVSKIPDYLLKVIEDSTSATCANADSLAFYSLIPEGCKNIDDDGIYSKTEIVENKAVIKFYSDDKCQTVYIDDNHKTIEMPCNSCEKDPDDDGESRKYICNTDGTTSMAILVLLMIFAFIF